MMEDDQLAPLLPTLLSTPSSSLRKPGAGENKNGQIYAAKDIRILAGRMDYSSKQPIFDSQKSEPEKK